MQRSPPTPSTKSTKSTKSIPSTLSIPSIPSIQVHPVHPVRPVHHHTLHTHVADHQQRLYPPDYHVYRRRWHDLGAHQAPGRLLSFLEWWPLVQELTERAAVAALVGEADARVGELRRALLVGEE